MLRKIPYTPAELTVIGMTSPFRKRSGKPVILGQNGTWALTPAFSDKLYEYSRKRYLEIN